METIFRKLAVSLGVAAAFAAVAFGQQVDLDRNTKGILPAAKGGATGTVNAQTGTTYTYLTGDRGKLVSHSNAASIAASLPQANSTTFRAGWFVDVQDIGAGTLTVTPTTSTINGSATLVLTTGQGAHIVSDGTNYSAQLGKGGASLGSLTGVIKASSGTPAVVGGTATDCVFVNATSGSCIALTSGAIVPSGACVAGALYINTAPSPIDVYMCGPSATWQRFLMTTDSADGKVCLQGVVSGQACIAVPDAAGAPKDLLLPITDPTLNQVWTATAVGAQVQMGWSTPTTVKVPITAASNTTGLNPADSTTYFWAPDLTNITGCNFSGGFGNLYSLISPVTGTVSDLFATASIFTILGTTENVTYTLMKNCVATTLTMTQQWSVNNPAVASDSAHTIAVTKGDLLQLRIVTPAWVTNPTNVTVGPWGVSITE